MSLAACICLSVCLQNNSKSYGWILMKFSENVDSGTWNKLLGFDVDPDLNLDPGI